VPVLNLLFSGPPQKKEKESGCLKAQTETASLSESTCGNGNSDLFRALLALISGKEFPTASAPSSMSTTIWLQDLIGNGYEAEIARGTLTVEKQVTDTPTELFSVSPSKLDGGTFDLEDETGWVIDRIWTAAWAGYVTDAQGVNIVHPALAISGTQIKLTPPDPVYGCLKIKYEVTRDKLTAENDGSGADEDEEDPYSTAVVVDVDGCEKQQMISLPAAQCLLEKYKDIKDILDDWLEDWLKEQNPDLEVVFNLISEPPKEEPQDTERVWDYCCRKFISADPESAAPADPENAYFQILKGQCGECEE
jgi:hypothetical protein